MNHKVINELLHSSSSIRVGKRGITENIIQELNDQLKKRKVAKIRFLRSVDNVDELLQHLEHQSIGLIAKKVGLTAIIVLPDLIGYSKEKQ